MEMMAAQRNDLAIGRVIAGLRPKLTSLDGMAPLLEISQQQRLLISRPHDQDRFALDLRMLSNFPGSGASASRPSHLESR